MLKHLKEFFSDNISIDRKETKTTTDHRLRIATCALLIEMASIDDEFDVQEKERISDHFKNDLNLSDEEIEELFAFAREQLSNRVDLWGFTNLINQNYTTEQKMKVIGMIWEVIYADGRLSAHEDYLVHKLYKMLNLSHKQLIEAKMKVLKKYRNDVI